MKKIEVTSTGKSKSFYPKGQVVEVSEEIAKILVDKGAATMGSETPSEENPYSKLKVDELRSLCAERGIEFADEKKAQLVELLVAFDAENEEEKEPTEE